MEENKVVTIPFVAHESAMNRMERANKRLWILLIVMFLSFMIYLFIPVEVTQDDVSQNAENVESSEVNQSIGD